MGTGDQYIWGRSYEADVDELRRRQESDTGEKAAWATKDDPNAGSAPSETPQATVDDYLRAADRAFATEGLVSGLWYPAVTGGRVRGGPHALDVAHVAAEVMVRRQQAAQDLSRAIAEAEARLTRLRQALEALTGALG